MSALNNALLEAAQAALLLMPDGDAKERLANAVDRAEAAAPIRELLRIRDEVDGRSPTVYGPTGHVCGHYGCDANASQIAFRCDAHRAPPDVALPNSSPAHECIECSAPAEFTEHRCVLHRAGSTRTAGQDGGDPLHEEQQTRRALIDVEIVGETDNMVHVGVRGERAEFQSIGWVRKEHLKPWRATYRCDEIGGDVMFDIDPRMANARTAKLDAKCEKCGREYVWWAGKACDCDRPNKAKP